MNEFMKKKQLLKAFESMCVTNSDKNHSVHYMESQLLLLLVTPYAEDKQALILTLKSNLVPSDVVIIF